MRMIGSLIGGGTQFGLQNIFRRIEYDIPYNNETGQGTRQTPISSALVLTSQFGGAAFLILVLVRGLRNL